MSDSDGNPQNVPSLATSDYTNESLGNNIKTMNNNTIKNNNTNTLSESQSGMASINGGSNSSQNNGINTNLTSDQLLKTDDIINKLLEFRDQRESRQNVNILNEDEIKMLCKEGQNVFLQQPMLIEMEAPVKICGDLHGQYHDLLRLFEYGGYPPESNYLFLGDYVDRGKHSLETICLLLAYKIKYPTKFYILRGNHECDSVNRIYGFYDECKRRYNVRLWRTFTDCFNCLPVAAIVDSKIFCMHGGLSPNLSNMDQIRRLARPCSVPDQGMYHLIILYHIISIYCLVCCYIFVFCLCWFDCIFDCMFDCIYDVLYYLSLYLSINIK